MGQTIMAIALAALALVTFALTALGYQLLRQQGRLLLRLDQVEGRLGLEAGDSVDRGTVALQARAPGGLLVGTALPSFDLLDLEGRPVRLDDLRGRRALLVNWSAHCSFCDLIAPDLAKLLPELERAGVRLLLVGHAEEERERELAEEHGMQGALVLERDGSRTIQAFDSLGTPSAYLLDAAGRVAARLAIGADQVLALAATLVPTADTKPSFGTRDLARSRIERSGLKAGTAAPGFELPEIRGGTVALDEYRGRQVLLVFSDPHCGPCEELAPHLNRIHQEHRDNGLSVVMVSRGEPDENRRKAQAHGYGFPVAVQRRWEVSSRYGIFATPVGFLIDEHGLIARDVARGVDGILELASGLPKVQEEMPHARAV